MTYNKRRAKYALKALKAYLVAKNEQPDAHDSEADHVDLITDILHHAAQNGLDTSRVIRLAMMHFDAEHNDKEMAGTA